MSTSSTELAVQIPAEPVVYDATGRRPSMPRARRPGGWLADMSVGLRLGLSFGLLGLAVALLGATAWLTGQATTSRSQALIEVQLPIERAVREWRTLSIQLGEMALRATTSTDVFPLTLEVSKRVEAETALVQDIVGRLESAPAASGLRPTLDGVLSLRDEYVTRRDQLVQDALDGKIMSQRQKSEHESSLAAYLKAIEDMLLLSEQATRDSGEAMVQESRRAQWISAVAVCFVLTVAALAGWLLRRSIVVPLTQASEAVSKVAAGDLTVRIDVTRQDELGQMMSALNRMVESLHHVVAEVRDAAESIHVASSEVATGNLDLSMRTEQAASNLQQTTASLEQVTGMVKENADNTQQAHELVTEASRVATEGGDIVRQVVSTMDDIQQSSKRIAEIIGIIDSIAFQTNVLALNAAVEAARAGEQGRGFAVVASEVRHLASRSADAAKEIKQLIGASVSKVGAGAELVVTAGVTMNDIVDRVVKIRSLMSEVNASTSQQSLEITQVAQAVSMLDQMTQQNAALVEQGTAAAHSLKEQATRLNAEMLAFRLQA